VRGEPDRERATVPLRRPLEGGEAVFVERHVHHADHPGAHVCVDDAIDRRIALGVGRRGVAASPG